MNMYSRAHAIAISIIDMEWPPETDDEEILDSSCYQLFAYTLGLGSTLCTEKEDEAKVQKLWDTAGAVATQVYGKSRATTAQVNAWDEYRGAVDKSARKKRGSQPPMKLGLRG